MVAIFLPPLATAQQTYAVTTKTLADAWVAPQMTATATVISENEAILTAEVTATISSIGADIGDTVDSGAVLVRVDTTDYKLSLDQARATLAATEARIKLTAHRVAKAERLSEKDFVSSDELLALQTDLAVQRADMAVQRVAIKVAERNLKKTTIRAPFAGVITERQAQVGSFVMPGTPLITIVQLSDRQVDVEVDPRIAGDLQVDGSYVFASQSRQWPVTFKKLSPVIDTGSRLQTARFSFSGEPAPIGTTGVLRWRSGTSLIPADLLVRRDGKLGVFVANSNRARFVPVPGAQEGRPAQTTLPSGTIVVVNGRTRLQDGDAISAISE